MDRNRWDRMQALFEAALALPPEGRAAFLDDACAGDAEFRQEVEALVASAGGAGTLIQGIISDAAAEATAEHAPDVTGRRVGPYRILRTLGRGGMGAVYLAERDDGAFRSQVAIKIVRGGALESPDTLRRFRSERQILASLDHPNIARLLDAGATDDGTPYVVMEFIAGKPLDRYCDEETLTVADRLARFLDVCAAVQYAHRNLIVHRDLKPSNVLVTHDGVPKLLDFGIAKLLDPDLMPHTHVETGTGMRLLTPNYASPEQVRGDPVTVASDVYSLGVILYELLTGHLPYRFASFAPSEIHRVVCQQEPDKPSVVVRRVAEAPARPSAQQTARLTPHEVSRARRSAPARLQRELTGDLDTIVMMALRKEPERRYESVAALAEDLRRYLEGRPVRARVDTWRYRAGKFVRRNALGVVAAAGLVLLLVAVAVTLGVQARRIAVQRDAATVEREKAQAVATFLTDLFRVADPDNPQSQDVTARELLDEGATRIRSDLETQPEVRASLMNVMGNVYMNMGLYDSAASLLQEAVTIRRAHLGADNPALAESLNDLASLRRLQGQYAQAEAGFREALAIRRRVLGDGDLEVATTLNNLAWTLQADGDYRGADSLYREALDRYRRQSGARDAETARVATGLAQVLQVMGEYDSARVLFTQALSAVRSHYGEQHREVALALHNLGSLLFEIGDLAGADTLIRQGIAIDQKVVGPRHPEMAAGYVLLARILDNKGEPDSAVPWYHRALEVDRAAHGEVHPDVAYDLTALAGLYRKTGRTADAEKGYREAIAIYRRTVQPENPYLAVPLVHLADLLVDGGRPREAEAPAREGVAVTTAALPADHRLTLEAKSVLGAVLTRLGDYEEAEPLLKDSVRGLEASVGADHRLTEAARSRLEELYRRWDVPREHAAPAGG